MAAARGGGGGAVCRMEWRSNAFGYGCTAPPPQRVCFKHPIVCKKRVRVMAAAAQAEEVGVSYEVLRQRLGCGQWQLADEETRRLLLLLAGDASVQRNYVYFSEVQFIPASHLLTIDELWRSHSNSRFGYSVQKRIWNKLNRDFTEFFKQVGWMKRLETEIEQYTYRSFPSEFIWELNDSTPEGHLPLTNALRGAQLLASILQHPAFDTDDDKDKADIPNLLDAKPPSVRTKSFTPNYKF